MALERKSVHRIPDVFEAIELATARGVSTVDIGGDSIRFRSVRMSTFFTKSCVCAYCGLVGTFFAKERSAGATRWHLNLYGRDASGAEVLFTHDHVIPRSKGGVDGLTNTVTACFPCNQKKADREDPRERTTDAP